MAHIADLLNGQMDWEVLRTESCFCHALSGGR